MRTGILSDESVMRDCADYQSLPMNVGPTGPTGPTGQGLRSRPQNAKTMINNANSITETQYNLIMDQHRRKIPQRPVALPAPPMRDVSGPQPLDYTNAPPTIINNYINPPPQPQQTQTPQPPTPQPPPQSPQQTPPPTFSQLIKKLTGNGNGNKIQPTPKATTQANEAKKLSSSQGFEAAQGTDKRSGKTRMQSGTLQQTPTFQRAPNKTPKSQPGAPSTSQEQQAVAKYGLSTSDLGGPH